MRSIDRNMSLSCFAQRRRELMAFGLVFAASCVVLLLLSRHVIVSPSSIEVGDPAANSLLVQQAKDLRLTVGNYSRTGFNHPGPALLYVLAAGEVAFFDMLPVAGSPFGGQIVGIALWNALLLTLIFRQFAKLASDRWTAFAGFSTFILLLTRLEPLSLVGSWFPHMYLLPFALFLISLVVARCRPGSGHISLGLAVGVLWNAHVAFLPITGVVMVLAFLEVALREGFRECVAARKRAILAGASVTTVLLVPLMVELARHWPSPLSDYVAFGSTTPNNSIEPAARFVASFWPLGRGGIGFVWIGVIATLWVAARRAQPEAAALVGAGLASTIAVMVYAVFGVDDLRFRYVLFFYRSAIALALTGVVWMIASRVRRSGPVALRHPAFRVAGSALAVAGAIGLAARQMPQPPVGGGESVRQDYGLLSEAAKGRRSKLHIDIAAWDFVWPRVVGVQLYNARLDGARACVATRWHVLFTKEAKCGPLDEGSQDIRVEAVVDAAGVPVRLKFVATSMRIAGGESFVAGAAGSHDIAVVLRDGWSWIEAGRVWSNQRRSSIELETIPGSDLTIDFDVEALLGAERPAATAQVSVNGRLVATWKFEQSANRKVRSLRLLPTGDGKNLVLIQMDSLESSASLGTGTDSRAVGIAVAQFAVRRSPTPSD